jgi:hypothetical protein
MLGILLGRVLGSEFGEMLGEAFACLKVQTAFKSFFHDFKEGLLKNPADVSKLLEQRPFNLKREVHLLKAELDKAVAWLQGGKPSSMEPAKASPKSATHENGNQPTHTHTEVKELRRDRVALNNKHGADPLADSLVVTTVAQGVAQKRHMK